MKNDSYDKNLNLGEFVIRTLGPDGCWLRINVDNQQREVRVIFQGTYSSNPWFTICDPLSREFHIFSNESETNLDRKIVNALKPYVNILKKLKSSTIGHRFPVDEEKMKTLTALTNLFQ